ncbi:hypothetical protein RB614_27745 [Phytohabitans sp. ZYX-F-186]|uniref:Subtilisin inhibitor domain-containing protein n=1 Tax=Phytohabitans maris TaxID=3071409 RepID=A0ABU0ZMR2_9ACTN|nr:hypothetical protein [Phytohabitans sp. ZYX-F-186]MDQ7908326.1 hypothetical protein [Phytohabitans sp. ZYX-F-186]
MTAPRRRRRLWSGLGVALLAAATLVAVSGSAASAAVQVGEPCTSRGYGSPRSYPSTPPTGEGPAGTAYIYYRSNPPTNCALFYANPPGTENRAEYIQLCLQRQSDGRQECDPPARGSGPYHTFAGPVYINAPGMCVLAHGSIRLRGDTRADRLNTGWVRCG